MSKTDDIDFLLTLHPHGWSTCKLFIHENKFIIDISHVFGDPYYDFIDAISRLIKGNNEVSFFWFGEPGGEKIEITRFKDRKHIIHVKISGFNESFEGETKKFNKMVDFEIVEKSFVTMTYLQLKKIELLLKEKSFAKTRNGEFPFKKFKDFELEAKKYLSL